MPLFRKNIILILPLTGILLFVALYIIATFYYPGGSQFDKQSAGFSWSQNYWCNLLNDYAINGQINYAKPIAMMAMVALCLALAGFWYLFPDYPAFGTKTRLTIQLSGCFSMTSAFLLFTSYHDIIVNVASFFGLIALAGTFIGLYKLKWHKLFIMGLLCLPLIAVNNILYYGNGLYYLPVVQKITFLYCLTWFGFVDYYLWKVNRKT